jgi:glycosyltransferase involved in cell wall biosynthesis
MRVWFLSHTFYPARGGIENYLAEVSRRALALGHRPAVVCRRHLPDLPEREEWEGVEIIRHPDFSFSPLSLFRKPVAFAERLSRWLAAEGLVRDGIAVCRYPHYGAALGALPGAAPAVYLPAALHVHLAGLAVRGGSLKERLFFRFWKKQIRELEGNALRSASRIMVFSRLLGKALAEEYGIPAEKMEINPPGVDALRFSPGERSDALARTLSLPPGSKIVLALGRLSPEKNIPFLIASLRPLLRARACALLLIGDGPSRTEVEKIRKEQGLEREIILAGQTDHPEGYYRLADVFVSASRYESFGQAILEAMSSGVPVVALKNSPPTVRVAAGEIVEDGRSGCLVAEDAEALGAAVGRLLSDEGLRRRLAAAGREVCRTRFTWERHLEGILGPAEARRARP